MPRRDAKVVWSSDEGDHRDVVVEMLRAEGYDVVLAGG